MSTAPQDGSNGYEDVADIYIAGRGTRSSAGDSIGADVVKAWAADLPAGTTVLDLGSGPGEPSTRILQEARLTPYAVEASPTMAAAFRARFPGVPIELNTVEASEFFNRRFGGVLAWGLLFLLDPLSQRFVIEKVARALEPKGRFDAMTGHRSYSLGERTYERLLRDADLAWIASAEDEGGNHYYFAENTAAATA